MLAVMFLPLVAACSDDNPVAPLPEVDAALVGTWIGPIEFAVESWTTTMTMNLNADGSMSVSLEAYPAAAIESGTWDVFEDEFRARGTSENDGSVNWVTYVAPRSATQLMGLAAPCSDSCDGDAVGGSFVVTKQ
jgi:hypothetical protein